MLNLHGHELLIFARPFLIATNASPYSVATVSHRAAHGEWVLVTVGMAGSVKSMTVPLRSPDFKKSSLLAALFV